MAASERGLSIHVHRRADGYDCTNGGPSARVKAFTVVGTVPKTRERSRDDLEDLIVPMPTDAQVFEPTDEHPPAVLVVSALNGAAPHLVPLDQYLSGKWTMSGGNLADSSDARMIDLIRSFAPPAANYAPRAYYGAIGIHDRIEH